MLMHLTGKRGETEILREIRHHYKQYFDALPGQSRLWHRIREALPLLEHFRRFLRAQLGVEEEEIRILDSMPIPVATASSPPRRSNGFDLAEGGYCDSKKLSSLGFKLGMLITQHGIPDVYSSLLVPMTFNCSTIYSVMRLTFSHLTIKASSLTQSRWNSPTLRMFSCSPIADTINIGRIRL